MEQQLQDWKGMTRFLQHRSPDRTAQTAVFVLSLLFSLQRILAATVLLEWNSSPDPKAIGYFLRLGKAPNAYTLRFDAQANTRFSPTNLIVGKKYFATVTAYNSDLVESNPSNEISFIVSETAVTSNPPALSCLVLPDFSLMLSWNAEPGRQYQVQYTYNAQSTNWLALSSTFFAESTSCRIIDPQPLNLPRHYRLQLLLENRTTTVSQISFAP
jgi:hypothetical protein